MQVSSKFMDLSRAKELIDKFNHHKVLVVGDVLLDHYVHGVVERINPEAPVPILRATHKREETGGAGNTAKNLAKMGARAILVGVVGDDDTASAIEKTATQEGYKAVLIRDKTRLSIRKERYLVGNQHMLRVDYEEPSDLSAEVEKKVLAAIKKELDAGVDAVIVSDYAKGMITRGIAAMILDEAGQRDLLVGADVKPSRAKFFTGASFVSPNVKEAYEFVGLNQYDQKIPPAELAKMVYQKMCANVFLTLGKEGVFVYCGGEGCHVPQNNVIEVADESGAGDTTMAVLLLSMLSGACENEAAELANAGGAVVVSKVGSVGISTDELFAMLTKNDGSNYENPFVLTTKTYKQAREE